MVLILLIIITDGNYSECRMVRKHADMANINKKLINKTDHSRSNSSMRNSFTQSSLYLIDESHNLSSWWCVKGTKISYDYFEFIF